LYAKAEWYLLMSAGDFQEFNRWETPLLYPHQATVHTRLYDKLVLRFLFSNLYQVLLRMLFVMFINCRLPLENKLSSQLPK
jgi:hypothetical protein